MKENVKANFIYQVLYQIVILGFPIFISPYIARVLGPDGFGTQIYYSNIAYIFIIIALLGIENYGNRSIAKVRDDKALLNQVYSEILTTHMVVSVASTVIYCIYCVCFASSKLYAWIELIYVLNAVFDISWLYYGLEKFKFTISRNLLMKCLNMLAIFIFVKKSDDIWIYCLILATGYFLSQVVLWFTVPRYVKYHFPGWRCLKVHMKPMFVLFIPTITISLHQNMDKIMLGFLDSNQKVGYYENASLVVRMTTGILFALGTVMLPAMSNLIAKKDMKTFNQYLEMSMRYIMIAAYALGFGVAAVGVSFSKVFWGDSFVESGILMEILAISVPFMTYSNVIRTQFLIPKERDMAYLISILCGGIVNVVANLFLIPLWSARGACAATLLAEIVVCLIQAFSVRKQMAVWRYLKQSLPFLLVGVIMFFGVKVVAFVCQPGLLSLILQVAAGFVIYLGLTWLVLLWRKDPCLAYIKAILTRIFRTKTYR